MRNRIYQFTGVKMLIEDTNGYITSFNESSCDDSVDKYSYNCVGL